MTSEVKLVGLDVGSTTSSAVIAERVSEILSRQAAGNRLEALLRSET